MDENNTNQNKPQEEVGSILEGVAKIFTVWSMQAAAGQEPTGDKEIAELFTTKLIKKKLEAFHLHVIIPDMLYLIIYSCATTPADAQLILTQVLDASLESIGRGFIPYGYVVTPQDFAKAFPMKFPVIEEDPKIKEYFDKLWDEQKDDQGNNTIDTQEFWNKYRNV